MTHRARPRILYVEHDVTSRVLVRRILNSEGYDVEFVDDGMSALRAARQIRPNLILVDINVGGLDGYEVATRIRSLEDLEHVPIVAVTSSVLHGDRERALISGCDGYIPKPIDVDRFPEQIRSYLGGLREEIDSAEEKAEHLEAYTQRLVKRLEEKVRELEQAHEELQRIEEMKSDFIMLASHELRTPLTSVYGYVQMLLRHPEIPGSSDEGSSAEGSPRHLLEAIADACKRLHVVFDEIRNVSLIDADRLDVAREAVTLGPMLHAVVDNLEGFGPSRSLAFEYVGLSDLPVIQGDAKRLRQALWNIISNAMKYTPDGGQIRIAGQSIDNTVRLTVEDSGVGIPKEEQERIFDRLRVLEDKTLHRSSKTGFKGAGLGIGLTVAKGIIEAHGGEIWVESEGYDEERLPGSTFHILFPVANTRTPGTRPSQQSENGTVA
ncbi:MAG: hybrid sensor histidine kinase/response regulator [Anaerolineae bacterium]